MCQSSIHMDGRSPADHRPKHNTDSSALPSSQSASWYHEFHFHCKRKCNLSDQATFFHCSAGAFAGGQGSAWALCMVHSSAAPWGELQCTVDLVLYCLLLKWLIYVLLKIAKWGGSCACDLQWKENKITTSNNGLVCMNLHSSFSLQSENINIFVLFPMITVYKANTGWKWLVFNRGREEKAELQRRDGGGHDHATQNSEKRNGWKSPQSLRWAHCRHSCTL